MEAIIQRHEISSFLDELLPMHGQHEMDGFDDFGAAARPQGLRFEHMPERTTKRPRFFAELDDIRGESASRHFGTEIGVHNMRKLVVHIKDLGRQVVVKCYICGADVVVQEVFGIDGSSRVHELEHVGLDLTE